MVMMYVKYPLSLRNVEDLLFELGIGICHSGLARHRDGTARSFQVVKRRAKVTPYRRAKLTPLARGFAVARRRSAEPLRSAARSRRAHPSRWI